MLYTASFYAPQNWVGSCFRISRGHPRGKRATWACLPFFYPELALLRAYRRKEVDFEGYTPRYLSHLEDGYREDLEMRRWMEVELPDLEDLTLLCFEREGAPCHRLLLAGWLLERCPFLQAGQIR